MKFRREWRSWLKGKHFCKHKMPDGTCEAVKIWLDKQRHRKSAFMDQLKYEHTDKLREKLNEKWVSTRYDAYSVQTKINCSTLTNRFGKRNCHFICHSLGTEKSTHRFGMCGSVTCVREEGANRKRNRVKLNLIKCNWIQLVSSELRGDWKANKEKRIRPSTHVCWSFSWMVAVVIALGLHLKTRMTMVQMTLVNSVERVMQWTANAYSLIDWW